MIGIYSAFDRHVKAVARACNYHAWVIRHIRHLMSSQLAATLTCSLILYLGWTTAMLCCMVLQSAVFRSCSVSRTLRRGSSHSRQGHMLYHCWKSYTGFLFVTDRVQDGRTDIQDPSFINPSVPRPSHQIASNYTSSRSSDTSLLQKPTTRTHFADRAFCCTPPTVWTSLNNDVVSSTSLTVFKFTFKTFLFRQTFRPSRFS